jgi:ABC-type sugar transport system substrate-binding protein
MIEAHGGRLNRPLLVGFDYEYQFEGDLRNGDLYAIVVQNPFEMGYRAVEQLVRFRRGDLWLSRFMSTSSS